MLLAGLACGGSTASPSSSPGPCTLDPGTYTEHFTLQGNPAGCGNVPDQTLTVSMPETFTGGTVTTTSGTADGGTECTVTEDGPTCTVSTSCVSRSAGIVVTVTESITIGDGTASGHETITSTDPTSAASCAYTYTVTKN